MAGIDKTYCKTWEEYKEVATWCNQHKFTCPNGIIIKPVRNIYEME